MTSPELTLTRIVDGSVEEVFRAWTDGELMRRWWGPADFSTPVAELDPRPGGHYRLVMQAPGGRRMAVVGTYREVDPPRRLVFTWRWEDGVPDDIESLVTLELTSLGARTELVLTHGGFPDERTAAPYRDGWEAALPKLAALFAPHD
jgi:uncharacterized protein YndB with AHSA1/START domain